MSQNNQENTAVEMEKDIPDMQRQRTSNSTVQIIGAIVIICIGLGSLLFLMINSSDKKETSVKQDRIENTLPTLVVQPSQPAYPSQTNKEERLAPVTLKPIKKPTYIKPVETSKPSYSTSKNESKEKIIHWYDRKKDSGTLDPQAGDSQNAVRNYDQGANSEANGFMIGDAEPKNNTALGRKLESSEASRAVASLLPDRNYLITQGTSLDCSLETALDSSLSGITTCILSRDVYSDNGRVLLLDRGSKLTGEYTGGLKNGQKRLFVLWTRAKTPNGVVVALNSPSADGLGRSGMAGWVDTHFLARFGTAIFLSVLKDAAEIYAAQQSDGNGTVVLGGSAGDAGEKVIEKTLDATADIPPTLVKNQGETIKVMVARDLDFSTVYDLKVVRN